LKTIIDELTGLLAKAFEECGYDPALGQVITANRPDLCDYQCDGALKGARKHRAAPMLVAGSVVRRLADNSFFAEISVAAPGFINLTLSDSKIIDRANEMARRAQAGAPRAEKPETIIVDYGGPNIAKPLHIGHLRAAIIGESIKRLMKLLGHKVIGDIHLGDWGLQIGLVIAELAERFPSQSCFGDGYRDGDQLPPLTADDLNEIYPLASQKSKEDQDFSGRAHQYTFDLQRGRPGVLALWRRIWEISVGDLKKNYEKLNVDFDLWYGESDADKYVERVISIFNEKGLLENSGGARVVYVQQEDDRSPVPPVIIIKSDGAVNYETTDIAALYQREKDFSPDRIWYVVDKRQALHFTQVFRASKKADIAAGKTELLHLGFGTMNGLDGKPYKTRDGGIMRLSDMIETVTSAALDKMKASDFVAADLREDVARKIGVAAIKFGDLSNHRLKDYVFDLDRFLSFDGKTGTYLLYTVTRINSILKKAGRGAPEAAPGRLKGLYSPAERQLLLKIIGAADLFWLAAREKAPNFICESAYQIAAAFSLFYRDNHILSENDPDKKESWLNLCALTQVWLKLHLDVLGIEAVDFM
jgi:arginyl-tRNA synthetase